MNHAQNVWFDGPCEAGPNQATAVSIASMSLTWSRLPSVLGLFSAIGLELLAIARCSFRGLNDRDRNGVSTAIRPDLSRPEATSLPPFGEEHCSDMGDGKWEMDRLCYHVSHSTR